MAFSTKVATPAAATASEPSTVFWGCLCGGRVLLHRSYCPACGRDRPPAPVKPQPLDTPPPAEVALAYCRVCGVPAPCETHTWRWERRPVIEDCSGYKNEPGYPAVGWREAIVREQVRAARSYRLPYFPVI